jgi:predicted nucleotidyltransferase
MEQGRSLLDLIGLAYDLEDLLGRKVEMVSKRAMKPGVRVRAKEGAVRIV